MVINLNFSYDKNVTKYYKSNKNIITKIINNVIWHKGVWFIL